jgi:ABC-type uncharacterized transport system fused permease/ATPase subunit
VSHAYSLYFQDETYYRVSNLDGRIENADHRLTDDITAFTSSVAHLYSHITKPLFDCLLIAIALARTNKKMGAAIIPGKQNVAPNNIIYKFPIREMLYWTVILHELVGAKVLSMNNILDNTKLYTLVLT